jgi:hypothetical protein
VGDGFRALPPASGLFLRKDELTPVARRRIYALLPDALDKAFICLRRASAFVGFRRDKPAQQEEEL